MNVINVEEARNPKLTVSRVLDNSGMVKTDTKKEWLEKRKRTHPLSVRDPGEHQGDPGTAGWQDGGTGIGKI